MTSNVMKTAFIIPQVVEGFVTASSFAEEQRDCRVASLLAMTAFLFCHRERSAAIPSLSWERRDCRVVALLAMTGKRILQ